MKTVAALVLVGLLPVRAWAFGVGQVNGVPQRWANGAISVWLGAEGSDDVSDGSDLTAIRQAMASWNGVSCSTVDLSEAGTVTNTSNAATDQVFDGQSVIVFVEDTRWTYGELVLAVTLPSVDFAGVISEADIAFNGLTTSWSTNDGEGTRDIEAVALHELGHLIGLRHVLGGESLADPPSMSPTALVATVARTLNRDDESGACYLYPASPYLCGEACDCGTVVDRGVAGIELNVGQQTCLDDACSAALAPATEICQARIAPGPSGASGPSGPSGPTSASGPQASGTGGLASVPGADGGECPCDLTTDCDSSGGDVCACDPRCEQGCAGLRLTSGAGVVCGAALLALSRRRRVRTPA